MTPNDIEVLLHCHVVAQAHPRSYAPAVQETIGWLLRHEIIRATDHPDCYTTTLKGQKLVEMLCDTPLPIVKEEWSDPRDIR